MNSSARYPSRNELKCSRFFFHFIFTLARIFGLLPLVCGPNRSKLITPELGVDCNEHFRSVLFRPSIICWFHDDAPPTKSDSKSRRTAGFAGWVGDCESIYKKIINLHLACTHLWGGETRVCVCAVLDGRVSRFDRSRWKWDLLSPPPSSREFYWPGSVSCCAFHRSRFLAWWRGKGIDIASLACRELGKWRFLFWRGWKSYVYCLRKW